MARKQLKRKATDCASSGSERVLRGRPAGKPDAGRSAAPELSAAAAAVDRSPIQRLPDEVLLIIFERLPLLVKLAVRPVCRQFKRVVERFSGRQALVAIRFPLTTATQRARLVPYHQLHGAQLEADPSRSHQNRLQPAHRRPAGFPPVGENQVHTNRPGQLFKRIAALFGNLRRLQIFVGGRPDARHLRIDLASFVRLRSLEVDGASVRLVNPDSVRLVDLRHLLLQHTQLPHLLHTCPALGSLECDDRMAFLDGPFPAAGHPLRQLSLCCAEPDAAMHKLRAAFPRLEQLTVDADRFDALPVVGQLRDVRRIEFNVAVEIDERDRELGEQLRRQIDRLHAELDLERVELFVNGFRVRSRPNALDGLLRFLGARLWSGELLADLQFDRRLADEVRCRQLRTVSCTEADRPRLAKMLAHPLVEEFRLYTFVEQPSLDAMPASWPGLRRLEIDYRTVAWSTLEHHRYELEFLKRCRSMHSLRLIRTYFADVAELLRMIQDRPGLQRLYLDQMQIRSSYCIQIFVGMLKNALAHPELDYCLSLPSMSDRKNTILPNFSAFH